MKQEQDFYRELSDIPALPSGLYNSIEKQIHRRFINRNILFALAASIVITISLYIFNIYNPSEDNNIQQEVASELQIINDYLNSSDLEEDLVLYSIVEGY